MGKKEYIYCDVLPVGHKTPLYYLCNKQFEAGDIVVIPLKDKQTIGIVMSVYSCTQENAPYPPYSTRKVICLLDENVPPVLKKRLPELKEAHARLFPAPELKQKLDIRSALLNNNVEGQKREKGKEYIRRLLCAPGYNYECVEELIDSLANLLVLSEDKKILLGVSEQLLGEIDLIIPEGVEYIAGNALKDLRIHKLFIPSTLKEWGDQLNMCRFTQIEISPDHPFLCKEGKAVYVQNNGHKELLLMLDPELTEYTVPQDVFYLHPGSLRMCRKLTEIKLHDAFEHFNEYAFTDTLTHPVRIPQGCRQLTLRMRNGREPLPSVRTRLIIGEDHEHFFWDEDSLYQVIEDGTYKLLVNTYKGKGKPLILDGTSVIGVCAFQDHEHLSKISLPDSVKFIEKGAFSGCDNFHDKLPQHIRQIEPESQLSILQGGSRPDFFDENAVQLVRWANYYLRNAKPNQFAFYNRQDQRITVVCPLKTTCIDKQLSQRRTECLERHTAGDQVTVKIGSGQWFVYDDQNEPLGDLPAFAYLDVNSRFKKQCDISATIKSLIPKQRRRPGASVASCNIQIIIGKKKNGR